VRRTLLVVLGILATALSQDVFGGVADWIGPVGVTVLGCTALAAWIVGDRRDRRAGYFHTDVANIAGIETETTS
jgi:cytochrome d ubiquinol oxidase subunit II